MEQDFAQWSSYSPFPTFNWCFQHAVLAEIPVVFFFIVALPILYLQLLLLEYPALPPYLWTTLSSMKYVGIYYTEKKIFRD